GVCGKGCQRFQHAVVLAGGRGDLERDLRQPGARGRKLTRKVLAQMPAPSEEHRDYPNSPRAFVDEIERRRGEVRLAMLEKSEFHRHTLHATGELVPKTLEWLSPARIACAVHIENDAEPHGRL